MESLVMVLQNHDTFAWQPNNTCKVQTFSTRASFQIVPESKSFLLKFFRAETRKLEVPFVCDQ